VSAISCSLVSPKLVMMIMRASLMKPISAFMWSNGMLMEAAPARGVWIFPT
jgi:hypothetical protein